MTEKLLAFHGEPAIKKRYLDRVRAHRAQDEIIRGTYGAWESRDLKQVYRGSAVGCTIHGSNHAAYERELGIPQAVAGLEDRLFESMPQDDALDWPVRFLEAIPVGADLSLVTPRLMLWLLDEQGYNVAQWAREDGKAAINRVAELYRRFIGGEEVTRADWVEARGAASAAASAAYAAAASAAAYAVDTHARANASKRIADELVRLLAEAPVVTRDLVPS